jgi:uncharacterized protein (DUF169 family)
MQWQDQISDISSLLKLAHTPVAVSYAVKLTSTQELSHLMVCQALLLASRGQVLDLSMETLDCPTAVRALGLGDPQWERYLPSSQEHAEQIAQTFCETAAQQHLEPPQAPPPVRLADHILLAPVDRADTDPDLILFLCNAEQACRLVALDSYQTGVAPRLEMSGSICHQAITYPYVTGELNLSLLDYVSRSVHGYRPEDLLVSVPFTRFQGIAQSLDNSTAGRK